MIFIDTGAFCAFADRSDKCHVLAVRQFSQLLKQRQALVTTNFIIDETYTWIRYRLGHAQAMAFLHASEQAQMRQPRLEVVSITADIEKSAVRLLGKYADQDLSYTDATSLAVINARKLRRAFTFDRHFHLLPLELLPGVST